MYTHEALKRTFEHMKRVTGVSKPMQRVALGIRRRRPQSFMFEDDGRIPNNPTLPLICYRKAVRLGDAPDAASLFEELFARNGWGNSWRDGIYTHAHFHSGTHEVLGIARGRARVCFGGDAGKVLSLMSEDVVVLPAGTGHQCLWSSPDLLVVGAYPPGGRYDECVAGEESHAHALQAVAEAPAPERDPVYGANGPLIDLWGL